VPGHQIVLTAFLVVLVGSLGATSTALAQAQVSLEPASDDTLLLVGTGWRYGQKLSITVGHDIYPAVADSAGGFEIRTGQPVTNAAAATLSVHREDTSTRAFLALSAAPPRDEPHPFAVLFAQGLAMGSQVFALAAGSIGVLMLTAHTIQSRRYTRK
jgi:hypothetical protein